MNDDHVYLLKYADDKMIIRKISKEKYNQLNKSKYRQIDN